MPKSFALLPLALLLLASVAFWPMYLSKTLSAIDGYMHVHAALGAVWLVTLITQPLLIASGLKRAHRITGRLALLVACALVVSSVLLTHFRASRMPDEGFAKEGIYIYLPLAVAMLFSVTCALGFHWRQSAPVHARFMLSTALLLLDPVLARLMFFHLPAMPSDHLYQGTTFTLITVAMVFLVRSLPPNVKERIWYRNYCLGSALTLALFFVIPYTGFWLAFALWFRGLPLT